MKTKVSLSILSISNQPISKINETIKKFEKHVDSLHLDPMDGKFVNNKTKMFPDFIKKIDTKLRKEAHLMVNNPEKWIPKFKGLVKKIFVHIEACKDIDECIKIAKKNKLKIYLTLKPRTKIEKVIPYLSKIDGVMIMTVEPGKAGQGFMKEMLKKVIYIRKLNKKIDIYVDGGIDEKTAKLAKDAGANHLVAGSYLLKRGNNEN